MVVDPDTSGSQGASGVRVVTRKYLFDRMKNLDLPSFEEKLDFLKEELFMCEDYTEDQKHSLKHLAYKLPVKKYRERKTDIEKNLEKERKAEIQQRFRNETGLLVDMPKANFGNTNDGNTSRRFFEDPKLTSEITGVDYELIYRLKVVLEAISSGHIIDTDMFDKYALDTARRYVSLYPWHPMTPTMHKILIHGADIIKNALLPIGQLSEEAAEARNKHFRLYRHDFARKFSRENCNRDIFNRLLLTSDPLLSSLRKTKSRKLSSFLPETLAFLLPAKPIVEDSDD